MNFDTKMNAIINKYLNPQWNQVDANDIWKTITLQKTDPMYKELEIVMFKDFVKNIFFIRRIENPILYEQFKLKVAECNLHGNITIRQLYHSTATENVDAIVEENLDWRLCNRVKFGKGISFSPDTSYANLQSRITNGRTRAMIVADVIVGYTHIGDRDTVIPDDGYDTTVSENDTVYVKYNDHEYYPKYVIYYETYEVKKRKNGERYINFNS